MWIVKQQDGKKAAVAKCIQESFEFPGLKTKTTSRKIEVSFSGGEVTSDGGVMLLREMDRNLGLTEDFAKHLNEMTARAERERKDMEERLRQCLVSK